MKTIFTFILTIIALVVVATSAVRFASAEFENHSDSCLGEFAALPQKLSTQAKPSQKQTIDSKAEDLLRGSPACENIIFTSERSSGKNDIVIMKPDGSGKVGLLPENLDGEGAAVSPDGTKVAFFSHVADVDYKLFVMNTDGSELLELTEKHIDSRKAEFSPDGTKILFQPSHVENEVQDIFIVNVDGTGLTNLTPVPGINYHPVFSPDGSKIVFNRRTDLFGQFTGHRLFSMNVDGTNVTQLTADTPDYNHDEIAFSPDGSKIVFTNSKYEEDFYTLEIINANGSGRARLTEGSELIFFPHFSPDSGKILFQRLVNGFSEAFLVNADGTNLTNLTNHPSSDIHADFNLDGSKIFFASKRDNLPNDSNFQIFSINADGMNPTNLTNQYNIENFSPKAVFFDSDRDGIGEACDNCRTNANADQSDNDGDGLGDACDLDDDNDDVADASDNCPLNANPSQLDTDGDNQGNACDADDDDDGVLDESDNCPLTVNQYRFAFSSASTGNPEIYTQNFDGTNRTRLTISSSNDLAPSFNRSGTQIVWESNRSNGRYEIYKMNANGTGTIRLTDIAGNNRLPTFSPDNSKIAFDSSRSGRQNIFIMDADGANQTQITFLTASFNFATNASFNQNGTRLAFESQRGSLGNASWDIYSINSDGTGEVRLTTAAGRDQLPSYSPDGSKIVFVSQRDGESLGGEIYIMNSDGSNQTRLTNNTYADSEPTFTPDGSRIMFTSSAGMMIMNLDGQDATLVPGGGGHPSFAPQLDSDGDGVGDACDNCSSANPNQTDTDMDGVADTCDNCSTVANPNQENNDGDALGDACDPDDDNDGVLDAADNCPFAANANQSDNDGDQIGDACDPDDDNDGVNDGSDNCPLASNSNQADNDNDEIGDVCDADDDNDGVNDAADNCPLSENPDQEDFDNDGQGDECDADDDNDGVLDVEDNCSLAINPNQADADADGTGDACDTAFDAYTETGSNVAVQTSDATVNFSNVSEEGTTSFAPITVVQDEMPEGFTVCPSCPAYEITTTATFTPPITVCLAVPAAVTEQNYPLINLLHGENGVFVNRTSNRFTDGNGQRFVCGIVDSLSPFVLASRLAPTAAPVSISGHVFTGKGAGTIARIGIRLLDSTTGIERTTQTDSTGFYRFDELETGRIYIVRAQGGNYTFTPEYHFLELTEDRADIDFTGGRNLLQIKK